MEKLELAKIRIYGQVQGVSFRFHAQEEACRKGIKGFVQNMNDGSVYIEAEADRNTLLEFLEWCGQGPESALVIGIEHEFADQLKNYKEFTIER